MRTRTQNLRDAVEVRRLLIGAGVKPKGRDKFALYALGFHAWMAYCAVVWKYEKRNVR